MADAAPVERGKGRVRSGLFEIDLRSGEVFKDGRKVALQEQPFRLLSMLLEHPGQVVTREELQTRLWPTDTYVGFEDGLNNAIRKLRLTFGDSADNPRFIQTVPRHGYRFIAPVSREVSGGWGGTHSSPGAQILVMEPRSVSGWATESSGPVAVEDDLRPLTGVPSLPLESRKSRVRWKWLAAVAAVCLAFIAAGVYWRLQRAPKLTEGDTIVLADFANSTGDPIFDETLKEALRIELRQSPFLNLLSERKVIAALKAVNRSATQPLTEDVAREVCRHLGSKAVIAGSIAGAADEYKLGLKAVDCNSGRPLARAQSNAAGKQSVLKTLDSAAISLRSELGEPAISVQKYATSLEQATTPSLEALKEYTLGTKAAHQTGFTASLPFYKHALQLDPGFAMAYEAIGTIYVNLNEPGRAEEAIRRAFELRDKVTEQQRLGIEASYYLNVTGELEKAAQTYELWQENYPRDVAAYGNLGVLFTLLGNHQGELEQMREAMRLEPNAGLAYSNLADAYQKLNRFDEAEAIYKQAEDRKLLGGALVAGRYSLAFMKQDTATMGQMAAASKGKPGIEDLLLGAQADTEAWYGRMRNARAQTEQAIDSALHNDAVETAAVHRTHAALREVESGNRILARADVNAALKLVPKNRDVRTVAALVLARVGDTATAEKLASSLDKEYPADTLMQKYWLPTIRAAIAVDRNDPSRAVEILEVAKPLELSASSADLCPAYVRGQAYLQLHDGKAAATEFQKYVDHSGLLANFPWGALARLGLARAYALDAASGPAARDKARKAYQDFLTLWKDADPDLPVLRQAKAEYTKVQ